MQSDSALLLMVVAVVGWFLYLSFHVIVEMRKSMRRLHEQFINFLIRPCLRDGRKGI